MSLERKPQSVKQQIEATPQIAELEDYWWKNPLEKLQEAGFNRAPGSVSPDYTKSGEMGIHTHPNYLKPSLPSFQDLIAFKYNSSRLNVVVAITSNGEVAGYTFVNKHPGKVLIKYMEIAQEFEAKKIRYYQIESEVKNIREEILKLNKMPQTTEIKTKISNLYTKFFDLGKESTNIILEQIKINGWRIRFVPMKNYQFKNGFYIPKPPSSGSGAVPIKNENVTSTEKELKEQQERKKKELERLRKLNGQQRLKN